MNNIEINNFLLSQLHDSFAYITDRCNRDNISNTDTTKWSMYEILEHISLTNFYLLKLIDKMYNTRYKKVNEVQIFRKDEIDIIQNGDFKWNNPLHHTPISKYPVGILVKYNINANREFIRQVNLVLLQQYEYLVSIINSLTDASGFNGRIKQTVQELGYLNLYEYIYFLINHIQRHIKQINNLYI